MAKISKQQLNGIRRVELAINKNLFIVCALITLAAMVMMVAEFFTQGSFPSSDMKFFYIGVLFIYSIHKELLRWLEEKKTERQGEWFVYSWIGLTIILYIINFLSRGYFSYSSEGVALEPLKDITVTTLEVCGIFIFTRLSKTIQIISRKK